MRAAAHPQQQERLETLRRYDILDTPKEADFDEIVQLASQICEAPISVVNLIDETRQWFKAEVGLGVRETPLETSICSHVILEDDFVEIPDTHADNRMADNPLCLEEPGLRFYAGARLLASNGMPLGTLCVLDTKPRRLTDLQANAIRVLSRQVMKQLELRLALKNQRILQSEMDHRVKNSLQSISSVVRIYGRTVEDANARHALSAVQRRIDAVATLHAQLQTAGKSDSIDTHEYLTRVISLLQNGAPENITIVSEIAASSMASDNATNLAMITSEFVANSIKHGFPEGRVGKIEIALHDLGAGSYRLECQDDGIGSSSRKNETPTRSQGIGMKLVTAAASNLGGTTKSVINEDGSELILEFTIPTDI